MTEAFSWNTMLSAWPHVAEGMVVTLQAVFLGSVIALVLGLGWALAQRVCAGVTRRVLNGFVLFVRNTPLLVQLYFLHYSLLPAVGVQASALLTGTVALGLHYSTYTAEVYRAGIDNVPQTQWDAAQSLHLSGVQTYRHVILPQAIPPMVPALGNYVIAMLKDAPLLSAIAVAEVLSRALQFGARTFRYVEVLTLVGVAYMVVSLVASVSLTIIERRLSMRNGGEYE